GWRGIRRARAAVRVRWHRNHLSRLGARVHAAYKDLHPLANRPPPEKRGYPRESGLLRASARAALRPGARASLAYALVEGDRDGDGGVERSDGAGHRQARERIARALHGLAETLAFGADDERHGPREVELVDRRGAGEVEAHDEHPALLERLEGRGQGRDAAERGMLDGTCRRAKRGRGEGGRAVLGPDDGRRAHGHRRANDGPEVLGVLDLVESDHQGARVERELVERRDLEIGGEGDGALVVHAPSGAIELRPREPIDAGAVVLCV